MSFSSSIRKLSVFSATAALLISMAPAQATPPRLTVNGVGNGVVRLSNPVQFQGSAADSDGIAQFSGSIHSTRTNQYVDKTGKLSRKSALLDFQFSRSQSTRWQTGAFNLPDGSYIFRVSVADGANEISPRIEVPFVVGSATAAPAPAVQASTSSAAPAIAIQFPQNGQTLSKAAAFSGIAKDDQSVVGVVATIMDRSTGMYLTPKGQFARQGAFRLRTLKGKNAQWSTPQVQLPAGDYLLSVKAVDNDGQEGQWVQSQFSVAQAETAVVATPTPVAPAAVASGGLAANGMAYCSNAGMDADGDGFGWQNNASCVVTGSKADKFPTCASSASDPDGDGYGWENEKSCTVVVHCANASSDPDGDGFGWENQRSCIVLKQANSSGYPVCTAGKASDPDGDGYGWENNATCLVR